MSEARVSDVVRLRRNPELADITDVSLDFELRDSGALPLSHLDQPNVTLYSFDLTQQSVVFVEGAESRSLAAEPFAYIAQRKQARRVLTLGFEEFLVRYSSPNLDPAHLVHLYSVGRCGSTLLHHALNQLPGVVSLSEPDVLHQLAVWRKRDQITNQLAVRLAAAALRCLGKAMPGASTLVIKHRGKGIWGFREFRAAAPARVVFLYRNAIDTIQSFDRAAGSPHGRRQWLSGVPIISSFIRQVFRNSATKYGVDIYRDHLTEGDPAEVVAQFGLAGYLLLEWISKVDSYLSLAELEPGAVALRYEDLVASPTATFNALLAACGLPAGDSSDIATVFAKDSQEGTALRHRGPNPHPLNPATVRGLNAVLQRQTRIPFEGILPNTLRSRAASATPENPG